MDPSVFFIQWLLCLFSKDPGLPKVPVRCCAGGRAGVRGSGDVKPDWDLPVSPQALWMRIWDMFFISGGGGGGHAFTGAIGVLGIVHGTVLLTHTYHRHKRNRMHEHGSDTREKNN